MLCLFWAQNVSQWCSHLLPALRWTRREQADFYRTVSSFGVIYDQEKKIFDWAQFRAISRLEKKTDESLEKYFYSFVAMCKNVCGLPLWKEDGEWKLHGLWRGNGRSM